MKKKAMAKTNVTKVDGKKVATPVANINTDESEKTPAESVANSSIHPAEVAKAIIEQEKEKTEQNKTAEPAKLELPAMAAEFCLQDETYWKGKDDIYNPTSKDCETCLKDFPNQPANCAARTAFLTQSTGKKAKTTSTKTPKTKVPKDGRVPQSLQIDSYIRQGMSIEVASAAIAERDFANNLKEGNARIISHFKAIVTGKYCRAKEMNSLLQYLSDDDAKKIGLVKVAATTAAE